MNKSLLELFKKNYTWAMLLFIALLSVLVDPRCIPLGIIIMQIIDMILEKAYLETTKEITTYYLLKVIIIAICIMLTIYQTNVI